MKKTIVAIAIFILFNTSIVSIGFVIPTSTSSQERQTSFLHLLSGIQQLIGDELQDDQKQIVDSCSNGDQGDGADDFVFSPEDITLKDDAFHGSDSLHFIEWWYFDAIFDNGYSIQMNVIVISIVDQYLVTARLNVYKDGEIEAMQKETYIKSKFYASQSIPQVILDGKQVLNGYIDHITGEWIYDVAFEFDGTKTELQFIGTAEGWKGNTPISGWAVILPKAEVTGNITLNDKEIEVVGTGYHDHNWDVTIAAYINFGWTWGKFSSNNYAIVWSSIMKTRLSRQPLLVVNNGKHEYINIEPENIYIATADFSMENWRVIPHKFTVIVDTEDIFLHVTMTTVAIDHIGIGSIQYWQYHVKCVGSITVNSQTETINEMQTAELMRFR